jgi:hypothetical protein
MDLSIINEERVEDSTHPSIGSCNMGGVVCILLSSQRNECIEGGRSVRHEEKVLVEQLWSLSSVG